MSQATAAVTLKQIKDRLRIYTAKDDAELIRLTQDASDWLERHTSKTFGERAGIIEQYDGPGGNQLELRQFPVTTTTTFDIRVDSLHVFGSNTALTEQTDSQVGDYVVNREEGIVQLIGVNPWGGFTKGPQVIKVTYSAGYTVDDMPHVVRQIIGFLVGSWYQRFQSKVALFASGKSDSMGSVSFQDSIPNHVIKMADTLLTPGVA